MQLLKLLFPTFLGIGLTLHRNGPTENSNCASQNSQVERYIPELPGVFSRLYVSIVGISNGSPLYFKTSKSVLSKYSTSTVSKTTLPEKLKNPKLIRCILKINLVETAIRLILCGIETFMKICSANGLFWY